MKHADELDRIAVVCDKEKTKSSCVLNAGVFLV